MRTILTSLSILFFSILLVIGCEVINKSLDHEDTGIAEPATLRNEPADEVQKEYSNVKLELESDEDSTEPESVYTNSVQN